MKLSADRHISRFFLVSLSIDMILQEPTITWTVQVLSAITDGIGLGDTNDGTLGLIKGQGMESARLSIP